MNKLEQILAYLGLEEFTNIFIYSETEDFFKYFNNGNFVSTKIPDFLKKYLSNDKCSIYFFRKDNELVVFYFFRIEIYGKKYVVVVQDNRDGFYLNKLITVIFENLIELKGEVVQLNKEIDFLRDELSVCEKDLAEKETERQKIEDAYISRESLLESLEDSVNVLRKSRQKMLKLIDGFDMPFFSMDLSYDITNVNKTLGKFLAEDNLPRLVGNKCYKIVYNFSEPCPWCKMSEIIEKKDDIKQHITVEKDGNKIVFEQTMYPIFDNDGVVVEFGEYLNDITEQYNMLDTIRRSEQEISVINRKNIETINEINTIRKAYNELSDAYEKAKDKIEKMTNVLNRLLQQDTVNELLALRSYNKELEVKLHKALTTIKNYSKKHSENSIKIDEMVKKSIYSIDRLYNIINNKKKIEDGDLKKVFDFLGAQILYIKNMIEKKEENDEPKSSN